ncbi:MAG: cobaltochelatase subunit CobN [Planctomycetota bacterium]
MIHFITAVDTELLGLSQARRRLGADFSPVRGCHLRDLSAGPALEHYLSEQAPKARVIVARILGGKSYFQEGFDRLAKLCRERKIVFMALPGSRELDPELSHLGTAPLTAQTQALEYFSHGGIDNLEHFLRFLSDKFLLTGHGYDPARSTPERGVHEVAGLPPVPASAPLVGLLFYRVHWLSGNLEPVEALVRELASKGLRVRAVFCDSLKDTDAEGLPLAIRDYLADADVLISTLAFASPSTLDRPVIQAIPSASTLEEWRASDGGLGPRDVAMHVALPEFDGRIISVPVSFKSEGTQDEGLGTELRRDLPLMDRVSFVAAQAAAWCRLRKTKNADRRVALLFNNYPTRNARVGNGVGLDTPASVVNILKAMKEAGYKVPRVPESGDALMHELLGGVTQDAEFQTPEHLEAAPYKLAESAYTQSFARVPASRSEQMKEQWGEAPGTTMLASDGMAIPGLQLGNVFVGIQPARGFGIDPRSIYHSPDLPPTHYYLGYYTWIRETFGAQAVIHVGKHGNLEWLPGKGIGLSAECYPEIVLGDLPNIYPFIINDPGEGTQAKRRAHAVIVDHMIPAMTRAESYGDLVKLEHLADEYAQVSAMDPAKRPLVMDKMIKLIEASQIYKDLDFEKPPGEEDLDHFISAFDGYLCEIKESQIRDGLHVLGELPSGEKMVDLLVSLVRLGQSGVKGLPAAIAEDLGLHHEALAADPAKNVDYPGCRTAGDLIEVLELKAKDVVRENKAVGPCSAETLKFLNDEVKPRLAKTPDEIRHILKALEGGFVPPGPSGAPTRAMASILPTGRNFFSVDIRAIPTQTAFEVGKRAAQSVLERHLKETGEYPSSIGMVVWGTSNMRTGGDDIAEILYLMGVKPVWQGISRRVTGVEVIPLAELGRPRVDVTVRISGFFRDAFSNVVDLLDDAMRAVAALDESPERNFLKKNPDGPRIFGCKPGSYGAGLLNLIDERNWKTDKDLEEVYVTWGGYAYGRGVAGEPAFDAFRKRLSGIQIALQNQDNREHDIFDSDDYFQFHGGMVAAARSLTGKAPKAYFGDTSKGEIVKTRDLKEEVARVIRSRVVNPKWIESIMKHGYRGAFEMAATVDYIFGYDATAHVVEDWMYENVARSYIVDPKVREFLEEKNPWALRGMIERLMEAKERGLWEKPPEELMKELQGIFLANEAGLEGRA